jgi:hypothetical protein
MSGFDTSRGINDTIITDYDKNGSVSRGLKEKEAKKEKQAEVERLKTDAADRVKSAVTRKGTQSEEIEERRAKKRKEAKKKKEENKPK